jgi:hypothetical protein
MKNMDLIKKIFDPSLQMNYSGIVTPEHVITQYCQFGSFAKWYEFVVSEQSRMKEFDRYYSPEVLDILWELKEYCTDQDFVNYISDEKNKIKFNRNNCEILKEFEMLELFPEFAGSFRGRIEMMYVIEDHTIIQTVSNRNKYYYDANDISTRFESLEKALINSIFKGRYFDALVALLSS